MVRRLSLVRSNIFISHPGISWKSTVGGQIKYLGGLLDSRVRCGVSYVHQWENTSTLWGVPSFVMLCFILLSLRSSGYHSSCTISPMAGGTCQKYLKPNIANDGTSYIVHIQTVIPRLWRLFFLQGPFPNSYVISSCLCKRGAAWMTELHCLSDIVTTAGHGQKIGTGR